MDWLILIFLVPLILIPIVLLCGFAGCGISAVGEREPTPLPTRKPPLPPSPENLSAVARGTNEIELNWTYNIVLAQFIVERTPRGTPFGTDRPLASNVSGTNFTDNFLDIPPDIRVRVTEGRTFLYQVKAFMPPGGLPSLPSTPPATVTTRPATPKNLVPTLIGTSQVQLSWTNASAMATKFSLEHRPSPDSGWSEIYKGPATTSPSTPLTPAGGDQYRVSAIVDGYDDSVPKEVKSNPSAAVSATPG
jgi:hypothetical protein